MAYWFFLIVCLDLEIEGWIVYFMTRFSRNLHYFPKCIFIFFNLCCRCWINESHATNVLIVLVCLSMALNLVFLCNIVRVLLVKLRAGPSHLSNTRPSRNLLQALRATLLLLPLLGLHYLLTPFRPPKDHPYEQIYEVTSAITASFQVNVCHDNKNTFSFINIRN